MNHTENTYSIYLNLILLNKTYLNHNVNVKDKTVSILTGL